MKRLMLVFISVLLSLILVEIFLRKSFPQKTYSFLNSKGMSCFQKSALVAFSLKPNCIFNFRDFDTGEDISAKLNSLGYRGEELNLEKEAGEKRILIEGDSFILGFGVRDQDILSESLQKMLRDTGQFYPFRHAKVVNAGYAGGFGPDGYYLHLKSQGILLKPDLVIFSVFVYNDLSDMENNEWFGIGPFGEPLRVISKTVMVDSEGHLVTRDTHFVYRVPLIRESHTAVMLSEALGKINALISRQFDRLRFKIQSPIIPSGEARDANLLGPYTSSCIFGDSCHRRVMHLFSDLISTIKASKSLVESQYKDHGKHFVVLLIPADFQIYPEALKKYNDTGIPLNAVQIKDPNPQRRIKEMLEMENIDYIDLLPVFRKSKDRLYFEKDEHWNKNGHKMAADEIMEWIKINYR